MQFADKTHIYMERELLNLFTILRQSLNHLLQIPSRQFTISTKKITWGKDTFLKKTSGCSKFKAQSSWWIKRSLKWGGKNLENCWICAALFFETKFVIFSCNLSLAWQIIQCQYMRHTSENLWTQNIYVKDLKTTLCMTIWYIHLQCGHGEALTRLGRDPPKVCLFSQEDHPLCLEPKD